MQAVTPLSVALNGLIGHALLLATTVTHLYAVRLDVLRILLLVTAERTPAKAGGAPVPAYACASIVSKYERNELL